MRFPNRSITGRYLLNHASNVEATGTIGGFKTPDCTCSVAYNLDWTWHDKIDPRPEFVEDLLIGTPLAALGIGHNYKIEVSWNSIASLLMRCKGDGSYIMDPLKPYGFPIDNSDSGHIIPILPPPPLSGPPVIQIQWSP
jgi:hypothetical protein